MTRLEPNKTKPDLIASHVEWQPDVDEPQAGLVVTDGMAPVVVGWVAPSDPEWPVPVEARLRAIFQWLFHWNIVGSIPAHLGPITKTCCLLT